MGKKRRKRGERKGREVAKRPQLLVFKSRGVCIHLHVHLKSSNAFDFCFCDSQWDVRDVDFWSPCNKLVDIPWISRYCLTCFSVLHHSVCGSNHSDLGHFQIQWREVNLQFSVQKDRKAKVRSGNNKEAFLPKIALILLNLAVIFLANATDKQANL